MQPGLVEDQSPVRPSLAATLAVLVGRDRTLGVLITLPVPNPCPQSVACSLTEEGEPGFYIYFLYLQFEAAKVPLSLLCYPTHSPAQVNLRLPAPVPELV